ncbi:SUZ RNA-binding domain-containing [Euwallacea fornicatus]|uniref:SUZ RNA-binding domain-containing n=1 Tax=Euwallacea fornicatus TaxID=995702 RepID=UPI00338E2076
MAAKQQDEALEIDNWEEIEETDVLEQKFNQLIMPSLDERSINGNINKGPITVTLTGDDALRSQYVSTEPAVKILKRPPKWVPVTNDNKMAVPKKTLQQREQEYAKARLRILGESSSEKPEERICIIKPDVKPKTSETENLIRMPKGPDGSNGFNMRR